MSKLAIMGALALALCGCTERTSRRAHRASAPASSQPDIELVVDAR